MHVKNIPKPLSKWATSKGKYKQLFTEAFSVITDDCLGLRWASKCLLIECLYFRVRTAAALPQNRK